MTQRVCNVCDDSHRMFIASAERHFPCTHCPLPCLECRTQSDGMFCETTPCACKCHRTTHPIPPGEKHGR